ncbi:hypothetical protein LI139_10865, partial [Veillonella atypica]|uniref:hypothetical protein n=1 Tax=Veillonella atypica TaxID=39777 RepID=UPI001D06CF63
AAPADPRRRARYTPARILQASQPHSRRGTWTAVVLIALLGALHAATLLDHPAPFVDEAWLAARAHAFLHTGRA